jgi:hypothetical protein
MSVREGMMDKDYLVTVRYTLGISVCTRIVPKMVADRRHE